MYIRKNGNIRTELSIDEPLSTDYDGNELLLSDVLGTDEDSATRALEEDEEKKIIYQAIATLSPREREIIELRFGLSGEKEMTQKDVADALGISQSYISRLEKRILLQLREEIRDKI
jgi:RNA polymerase sporulation-specific sigma factor